MSEGKIINRPFLVCPCGHHEWRVDHLVDYAPGRCAGPWYCDACGQGFDIVRTATGFDMETREGDREKKIDRSVLLKIPPQKVPIWLVVKGMRFGDKEEGSDRYFYEEHTCPTNYLRDCAEIMIEGDTDPHGIAEFVLAQDGDPFEGHRNQEREISLIQEMVGKAEAIDAQEIDRRLLLAAKGE